jgi:hypothetical protein
MIERKPLLVFGLALVALVMSIGCGDSGASKADEDAYKSHDKNAIHGPPPGWKPSTGGHTSIDPGGPVGPPPAGK